MKEDIIDTLIALGVVIAIYIVILTAGTFL
jgi:hypothetical protein